MNICFSLDKYDGARGGAALAVRALARHLAERGHRVQVLQPGRSEGAHEDGGVRVHTRPLQPRLLLSGHDRKTLAWNRDWYSVVDRFLDEQPTDLMVTQNRLLYSSVDAAAGRGVPAVVWVHAYRLFCPTQFRTREPLTQCEPGCLRCVRLRPARFSPAIRRNREKYLRGLHRADLVLANSEYMQRVLRHLAGIEAPVVYPTFDLDRWARTAPPRRGSVLFVKPLGTKGFPIFLEIAKRMPDVHFIVAGKVNDRVSEKLRPLPNVEAIGWIDDMAPVYARARVLLGPSLWPEPFGRVFVEAACAGVPSIASARGGIPEAVGASGILIEDVSDIDQWVRALRRLDDPETLASHVARTVEHAKRFAPEVVAGTFYDSVERATGLAL